MNYTNFIDIMQNKVKEELGADVAVSVHSTVKNNGIVRTGLVFTRFGVNIAPTIYLEEFYEQYLQGMSVGELVQSICEIYEKVEVKTSFPCTCILDYSKMKERIVYKVIQREKNKELLKQVPHEEFLDLAVVYYALLRKTEFGTATLLIKNEHIKEWNVSKEEIQLVAKKNTPRLLPMEVLMFTEHMYVLTNSARNFGAGVMMYEDVLEEVGEVFEENFYVLPSSVHEVIAVPESFGIDKSSLREMVKEINETVVDDEEILSDTVYYYSRAEKRLFD